MGLIPIDNCVEEGKPNVYSTGCLINPSVIKRFAVVDPDFGLNLDKVGDAAYIEQLRDEGKIVFVGKFIGTGANNIQGTQTQQTNYQVTVVTGDSTWDIQFLHPRGYCMHSRLNGFNGKECGVFPILESGEIIGRADNNNNKFYPIVSKIHNEPLPIATDKGQIVQPTLRWLVDDTRQYQFGFSASQLNWDALNLAPIKDIDLEPESIATGAPITTFDVKASVSCIGTPVIGLVVGDFVMEDADGNIVALDGVTDNADGTYSVDVTTAAPPAGTYSLTFSTTVVNVGGTVYTSNDKVIVTAT